MAGQIDVDAARLRALLPDLVRDWLLDPDAPRHRLTDATVLSADISGFTRLAEQLAQQGARQSSEALTEAINRCFAPMIEIVHRRGGDVLKFGGDALFVVFDGESLVLDGESVLDGETAPWRACAAAAEMQSVISTVDVGVGVPLSMTVGVSTGQIDLLLAGASRRELVVYGPTVDTCLQLEDDAERGEVLIDQATADALPSDWVDKSDPEVIALDPQAIGPDSGVSATSDIDLTDRLPIAPPNSTDLVLTQWADALGHDIAAAVDAFAGAGGELRFVNIAFVLVPTGDLHSDEIDALIDRTVELGERFGTTLIGVDVYRGGMKILLAAGTPTSTGSDEDAILSTVAELVLAPGAPPMRAGVNRGLIYTGFLGSDRCQTFTVMGDAVNLAARLLGKAELGSVVVSDAVLSGASTGFDTTTLPPLLVRGRTEPVIVHRLGARTEAAPSVRPRPPFVGRESEIGQLTSALDAARQGNGSAIELVGESGIGTTRLVEEFIASVPPGVLHFELQANLADRGLAFATVRPLLRAVASISNGSPAEEAAALIRWVDRIDPGVGPLTPLIASAFGVEVDPTPESEQIVPRFREARTQEVITDLIAATLVVPTIVFTDNVHLGDRASIELLGRLGATCADRPWLVLVSRRTGSAPFTSATTSITLERLSEASTIALIAGASELPDSRQSQIARRSDGNPLFALELVESAGDSSALPDSIEALMTARIDRLGHEARNIVRTAAVVGTDFRTEILNEAVGEEATSALGEIEEFFEPAAAGRVRFRSTIGREVAYDGLSARRKRELHAAVAAALDVHGGELGALAWHHDNAGHDKESWHYSMLAAAEAHHNGALHGEVEHLRRAVAAADRQDALPDGDPVAPAEDVTQALIDLFNAAELSNDTDLASSVADRTLDRITDPLERIKLLCSLCHLRGEVDGTYVEQIALLNAELTPDTPQAVQAWIAAIRSALEYRQGEIEEALTSTDIATAAASATGEKSPLALALIIRHAILADRGQSDDELRSQLVDAADDLGDEGRTVSAHNNIGEDFRYRGDWLLALEHYEIALKHASRFGDARLRFFPSLSRAMLLLDQGRLDEAGLALDDLHRSTAYDASGFSACGTLRELGRYNVLAGDIELGKARLIESLTWARDAGAQGLLLASQFELIAADLAEGRSGDVLAAAAGFEAADLASLPITSLGRLDAMVGYAHLQQGDPERGYECFVRAIAAAESKNRYGHAYALVGKSEAESFLGRGRSSTRTRAEADEILDALGVAMLPVIPLPK